MSHQSGHFTEDTMMKRKGKKNARKGNADKRGKVIYEKNTKHAVTCLCVISV